ncbi:TIGR04197 family type VII secretion effector [Staphylococcus caledonicus]|uniref:TIGR04197 family type VII secretion effector n=1 Tax=Staphylococcus caledonicus TaxID=2741333 RepID=UPI0018E459F7|nr:TIGR04197 family type VII secretion effector [Staphylococcus caledonicus]MBI5972098.1 TIGR04197 family type VII secretion effector [Staphylococcus caledonicus]
MGQIKSDSTKTNNIFSNLHNAISECENISEPSKDESTTIKGNTDAHYAIENLREMNKSVAQVIEMASKNIQNVGQEFEHTDQSISNEIGKS